MSQYWNAHRFLLLWGTQDGAAEGTKVRKSVSQGWPLFSMTQRVLNSCQVSYSMSSHHVYNFLLIKLELSVFWKNPLEVQRPSRAIIAEVHGIYTPWGWCWPSSLRHRVLWCRLPPSLSQRRHEVPSRLESKSSKVHALPLECGSIYIYYFILFHKENFSLEIKKVLLPLVLYSLPSR